jgi:hypothetical protein
MTSFPTKDARISIKNSRKILRNNWLRIKVFLDDSDDSVIETIFGSRCDLGEGNVAETGFARLEQAVRAAVTFA